MFCRTSGENRDFCRVKYTLTVKAVFSVSSTGAGSQREAAAEER